MAEAAATFLLEQLKEVVIEFKDLISRADHEFMELKNELESLKAFLKDIAKKKKKDNMFRVLESRTTNLVYEMDNIIDLHLIKTMTSRMPSLCLRTKLAKRVKSIREDKVLPLFAEFNQLTDRQKVAADGSGEYHQPNEDITPIRKNKIIGFEDVEIKITGYLKEETEKLDVISIIGMPGQGKTALAWKIYQNMDSDFHQRIWVDISQEFNIRDICLEILGKLASTDNNSRSNANDLAHSRSSANDLAHSRSSANDLAQTVRKCLEKDKFLLVLDDVWSVDDWKQIKEVLPENKGSAKVLITSRNNDVGLQSRVYTDPQNLRPLNERESWELLNYEVFGDSEVRNSNIKYLTDIMHHIASKCDGVPLTIVLIGGILASKYDKSPATALSEWERVSNSVSYALQNDKAQKAQQRITNVIELSYNRLPDDLRECFVYLGVFPEDYKIPTKMLCGLWISEGFIIRKDINQSLEECAEENLNDLLCRNLVQVEKTNHMGRVKTCRVHDMIRAFCIAKAKEVKLYQEVKGSIRGEFEPSLSELQNSHRLSLSSDLSLFLSQKPSGPLVRSFLCLYDEPVKLEAEHIDTIPNGFGKLRILESRFIKFDQFPPKVTKLIHLRYLTLNIDNLKTIPKPIMLLWNLQSLLIQTMSRTIAMKANIWKMIRLRYLWTKAAIVLDGKQKGDAGQNLHTLNRLSPESCTESVAKKAKNLRTLGISGKLTKIFDNKFLEKLLHLDKLKLVHDSGYEQTFEDWLHTLPPRNCFPPNLKRLTLKNTFINWHHMSTLAMIKSLEALKLRDNAFVGLLWKLGLDEFPNLQLLLITNIKDLVSWEATDHAFPQLKFLVVKNCRSLLEIPEHLGTSLEKLEIELVQDSVVKSAEKIRGMKEKESGIQFNLTIGPGCGSG